MSIYEYNEEYARKAFYEDGWEDGFKRGVEQGIKQGIEQGIQKVIEQGIELGQHQGKLMLVISLIRDGILTKKEAADRSGISMEQLEVAMRSKIEVTYNLYQAIKDMIEDGKREGRLEDLAHNVDNLMKSLSISLEKACELLGSTHEDYEYLKRR